MPIRRFLSGAALLLTIHTVSAAPAHRNVFLARAQQAFDGARTNYLANTNSLAAIREFARTSSLLAGEATNDTQRAQAARQGIHICRQWLARQPQSGPGHYYLAINLGQLAEAEAPSFASYRLVHQVEREFKKAASLDVNYDHAGPARTLGLLYYQAPGWPLSVGSKRKAREWLERAATLAPEYPENLLNLGEAQLKWRQHKSLEQTIKKLNALWPVAKTNFTGKKWEEDWQDWSNRFTHLKAEFQRLYGTKP